MKVTFIHHSGFMVELPSLTLVFDWWRKDPPPFPQGKPLYVFASHWHEDHFNPKIFQWDGGSRDIRFLLGHGIGLTPRNMAKWGVRAETAEKCRVLKGGETCRLPCATVEALLSTDEGAAFLVEAEGKTLYHAGDLNWWHWSGEDKAWNRNMEVNFKRYVEPLRDRDIDLAMLPLDPRQGEDAFLGFRYYLELARIRRVLPMHQWSTFDFTDQFLSRYPSFAETVIPVARDGQVFTV